MSLIIYDRLKFIERTTITFSLKNKKKTQTEKLYIRQTNNKKNRVRSLQNSQHDFIRGMILSGAFNCWVRSTVLLL